LAVAPPSVSFAQPPIWWRVEDEETKMSRTVAIGLCLLLSINLAVLALNLVPAFAGRGRGPESQGIGRRSGFRDRGEGDRQQMLAQY
jgi:hypothetical protein